MTAASRELEILVAKIQAQLAPDAEVLHDVRLPGRLSRRDRQIDVLVKQRIGQYEMTIVLDCKDLSRPLDVKGVEEFQGLVEDVGANKGVLVCPRGFTDTAKTRATGLKIDLYSPVDTDPHKWQARVEVPVLCDFRRAAISIGISSSAPMPLLLPMDFHTNSMAFAADHEPIGIPLPTAIRKWNDGRFPADPGEHLDLPIYDAPEVLIDNGYGAFMPATVTASIYVERTLHFGQLPLARMSGFKDELTGAIITNAFTTGIFDADDVVRNW
ncbi:MAG TPA: restriction endonuclease, partial [Caulobacteraceae bacterium]